MLKQLFSIIIVMFVVAACTLPVRSPREITKAEVRAMISEMDKATKAQDVKAIMSFLADDVEISIIARGPLGSTMKTMDRKEYERELRRGMSLAKNYDFRTNIQSIAIAPDGLSAVVVADIYEVVEMMGVKAASYTKETSVIQRRNGKLKAVKISAESEIQMTPGPDNGKPQAPQGI